MTPRTHLEEALEAWAYARTSLIAEAELVPDDGYRFRPHPHSRDVHDLLLHVVQSGELMVGELSKPDGDFTRKPHPDLVAEHAGDLPEHVSPEELRALLRHTLDTGTGRLRRAGEAHMLGPIRRFDGETSSRLTWMHHGIAHEEYHRGQMALYVRLQGIVPALTRAIHGETAR